MNWNNWIRQVHRWLAVAFTLAVIANLVVMGQERIALWVGLATLVPLIALMVSGLYMFVQPYVARWRGARRTGAGNSAGLPEG